MTVLPDLCKIKMAAVRHGYRHRKQLYRNSFQWRRVAINGKINDGFKGSEREEFISIGSIGMKTYFIQEENKLRPIIKAKIFAPESHLESSI